MRGLEPPTGSFPFLPTPTATITIHVALRQGIYCMGFMGLMPVVRGKITRDYPDTLGATPYTARLSATFIATPIR